MPDNHTCIVVLSFNSDRCNLQYARLTVTCQKENAACYILLIKKQLSYISYTCVVPNVEKVFDVDRMFYV